MGISVLIPTYNRPHYLVKALESVLNQSLLPDEIIIADDNIDDRLCNFRALKDYLEKFPFIKYVQNIKRLGGFGNYKNLLSMAQYEYIKFLAEDDLLAPDNLKLLSYYLDLDENIKVATSVRTVIDESTGREIFIRSSKKLFEHDTVVDGKKIIALSLTNMSNYVGEFSTYMFRRSDFDNSFFDLCSQEANTNADWLLWMNLVKNGKIAYISKPLSTFRYGKTNDQLQLKHIIGGIREMLLLLSNHCLKMFQVAKEVDLFNALEHIFQVGILHRKSLDNEQYATLQNLVADFIKEKIESCENKNPKQDDSRDNTVKVSVIVVTYNSEKTIKDCLGSLLKHLDDFDEIVIVDNKSSDKTVEVINSFDDKRIVIIENDENIGYACAINTGIEYAQNDYFIFLNPDTIVTRKFKEKLLRPILTDECDASSPLTSYVAAKQKVELYTLLYHVLGESYSDLISDYLECKFASSPYIESKLLIGFCLAVSRKLIDEIGGLDEDLFLGNDDLEFSWRLQLKKKRQFILRNCFIYHIGHHSFDQVGTKSKVLVEESTKNLARKLIKYYGYGNVPMPNKLWEIEWFTPKGEEFEYMFRYSKVQNYSDSIDNLISEQKFHIGVVLVNYNNYEDTKRCIKSLQQSRYKNFEILVVDNSDIEEDVSFGENKTSLQIVKIENNGFAHAVNHGIKELKDRCSYIWILNNDTIVENTTMEKLLETSLKTGSEVVTCKIKDFNNPSKIQYDGIKASYSPFADYEDSIKEAKFLSGANMFVQSKVFDVVGFLDEQYFLYYEDTDFHWRLLDNEIIPTYTPFTSIFHKGGASIGPWKSSPLSVYYAMRNLLIFKKKFKFDISDNVVQEFTQDFYRLRPRKELLKVMLVGLYDGVHHRTGKKQDLDFYINYNRSHEKLLLSKLIKSPYNEKFVACMNKPRDKNLFLDFIYMIVHRWFYEY